MCRIQACFSLTCITAGHANLVRYFDQTKIAHRLNVNVTLYLHSLKIGGAYGTAELQLFSIAFMNKAALRLMLPSRAIGIIVTMSFIVGIWS